MKLWRTVCYLMCLTDSHSLPQNARPSHYLQVMKVIVLTVMTTVVTQISWDVTHCYRVRTSDVSKALRSFKTVGTQWHNTVACKIWIIATQLSECHALHKYSFVWDMDNQFPTLILPITRTISGTLLASDVFEYTMIKTFSLSPTVLQF
jgi:hypothetical protein